MTASPPSFPPAPPPSSGPNRTVVIVAAVAAVIVLAAVAAFVFAGGSDSSTSTGTSSGSSAKAVSTDSGASADTGSTADTTATDSGGAGTTCESGKTAGQSKGKLSAFSTIKVSGKPLSPFEDSTTDPAVGTKIPTVTGSSFDGTKMTLTCPGKPALVMFVAHWCPHCQREVPALTAYWKQHGLPKGVDLVSVATGSSADQPNFPPQTWLKKAGWPVKVLADSKTFEAGQAFGLASYPYFVMVDKHGKVAARFSGELDPAALSASLEKLAAGKDPQS